jgi:hypothetical protein
VGGECKSSRYTGVFWSKASSSWEVSVWDPQTKRDRYVGTYGSEEDAARAYDCAAVQAHGPGVQRNFPCEAISELPGGHFGASVLNYPGDDISERPVTVGGERKSSRYVGVFWERKSSSWKVSLRDPQTKRDRYVGAYASEEDAARAYDCAAVQAHGPAAKRNFPCELISEAPATKGEERKQRSSSRYIGVCWHKTHSAWGVSLFDPQTKQTRYIGSFASEEDAARAYDCAAVQAHGPGAKRNFPDDMTAVSEPPAPEE